MHHSTERVAHTTSFVIPIVEHWFKLFDYLTMIFLLYTVIYTVNCYNCISFITLVIYLPVFVT